MQRLEELERIVAEQAEAFEDRKKLDSVLENLQDEGLVFTGDDGMMYPAKTLDQAQ